MKNIESCTDLRTIYKPLLTWRISHGVKVSEKTPMSPLLECKRKALAYRETFSLRTQDAWEYEFDTLIQGNGMLQDTSNCVMLFSKYKERLNIAGSCVFLILNEYFYLERRGMQPKLIKFVAQPVRSLSTSQYVTTFFDALAIYPWND